MNDNRVIEPAQFTRAQAPGRTPRFQASPAKIGVLALFIVLAVAALFMFNARAVKFSFDPASASMQITSGMPTYRLGERFLMLKGDYDIQAFAEGYNPLITTVSISGEAEQGFTYPLIKLPGILEVTAEDQTGQVSDAEVFIDQQLKGLTPTTVDEVLAGTRELYIEHPRYLPYQEEVEIIGRRERQSRQITLAPAWAIISITSLPADANILLNDIIVGKTPASIEVLQGDRSLKLQRSGYKTFESTLQVVAQQDQALEEIVLIKSDGKLNIVSKPSGANITISGLYQGQTPLAIALAPSDEYTLTATKAGYQSVTRALLVRPDEDQSLSLNLKPVVGIIKLSVTPSGATLFVDDKNQGDPNQTLELTARSHELKIELPGYASFVTQIIPQPGLSQQLNIALQTEEAARVSAIPQQIKTSQQDILRFIVPEALQMGAGRREPGRRSNEILKDVELTRAYYLGEKEITNQSFKAFNPGHDSGLLGRALLSDPDRPVVNVSWRQAIEYCNWLSLQDGLRPAYEQRQGRWQLATPTTTGYRLPTEAEWAWAARYAAGRQSTRFPWGNAMPPSPGAGNFADASAANMVPYSIKGYNDNFRGPAPSGTFKPNELGIFDLAGNVSEWIHDYYSVALERKTLTDPVGPAQGDYYVIRGSNYTHGRFSELRWTFRDYGSEPRADVGFRIARWAQ